MNAPVYDLLTGFVDSIFKQAMPLLPGPLLSGVVKLDKGGGRPRGEMVKVMDCGIVVREFVLQSRYYVHFRASSLGKGMNPLILPAIG